MERFWVSSDHFICWVLAIGVTVGVYLAVAVLTYPFEPYRLYYVQLALII